MELDSQQAVGQEQEPMLLWKRAMVEVRQSVPGRQLEAVPRAQEQPAEKQLAGW